MSSRARPTRPAACKQTSWPKQTLLPMFSALSRQQNKQSNQTNESLDSTREVDEILPLVMIRYVSALMNLQPRDPLPAGPATGSPQEARVGRSASSHRSAQRRETQLAAVERAKNGARGARSHACICMKLGSAELKSMPMEHATAAPIQPLAPRSFDSIWRPSVQFGPDATSDPFALVSGSRPTWSWGLADRESVPSKAAAPRAAI